MELAYERHGTGPTLVLLHGVGHRRQAWQPVLDLLTPHRTVIMVDLPGHGDSPPLRTAGRRSAPSPMRSSPSSTRSAWIARTSRATRWAARSRWRPGRAAGPRPLP